MVTSIEGAIESILLAASAVTDLTGSRIYSNMADQETTQSVSPYVVIVVNDTLDEQTMDGAGVTLISLMTDIYHEKVSTAIAIEQAIYATLQDYSGTQGTITIQELWRVNKTMARNEATEQHVYRIEWNARLIN